MAGKPAILSIEIVSDAKRAASGLNDTADGLGRVEDAAKGAARAVSSSGDAAKTARRSLDDVASSTDNLDSKAASATGALGALSSGFELVGLEKYATGLQSAAMATDFFSGVGEASTLVLTTIKESTLAARAAALKHTVATKASAVATKAQAVAQRILNVAMRANPIGLVITAVLALAALFIVLYKRSATFRRIVDTAMAAIRRAFDAVGDVARRVWDAVVRGVQRVGDWLGRAKTWVADRLGKAFTAAKDTARNALDAFLAPIQWVIDKIKDLIGWIRSIDFPSPPGWLTSIGGALGFGGGGGGSAGLMSSGTSIQSRSLVGASSLSGFGLHSGGGAAMAGAGGLTVVLQGVYDEDQAARRIEQLLGRRARRVRGS